MIKFIGSILLCSVCVSVYGHESANGSTRPDSIEVKTTVTYRSDEAISSAEIWQIPGVLMGGEALPVAKGATLDDVQLLGHLNVKDNYFVSSKIGAHSHEGSTAVELENLWFGATVNLQTVPVLFEVGKMSTEVTPTANFHASTGAFSESPLLADVFFGRHFVDIGARASSKVWGLDLGVEVFNGDNWPSSSGDGTAAIYMHYPLQQGGLTGQLGSWFMHNQADNRIDTRYEDGHSHNDEQLTASDLTFTGNTLTLGFFANLEWQLNPITLNAAFEWIQADIDGQLVDTTQSAYYVASQDGYKLQFGATLDSHSLDIKYERLVLVNHFTQTSQTFIQSTGLYNQGFEPEKLSLAWTWDFYQDFTLRTEWIQDNTQKDKSNRWSLGLVWQHKLL